jgi:aryl carrier-like protein
VADRILTDRSAAGPAGATEDIERFLCDTCADLLEVDEVSPEDNLFDLGFDSFLIISLAGAAEEAGLPFDPSAVVEHETIAELARAIGQEAQVP